MIKEQFKGKIFIFTKGRGTTVPATMIQRYFLHLNYYKQRPAIRCDEEWKNGQFQQITWPLSVGIS